MKDKLYQKGKSVSLCAERRRCRRGNAKQRARNREIDRECVCLQDGVLYEKLEAQNRKEAELGDNV